jgi:ketosteroid isomerase-like protein
MTDPSESAMEPEAITRLFVQRANQGDAAGLADLYEPNAVLAYPPGQTTTGRDAIRRVYEHLLTMVQHFEPEESLPTLRAHALALTSPRRRDGKGLRIQVARRQAEGQWLRVLDWPEPPVG